MMLLNICNLSAYYTTPDRLALQDVNVSVLENEIVALLGPNGAGKSSILKAIFKEIKIKHGSISLIENDITTMPTYELVRAGVGYIPERGKLFYDLTVEENLDLSGYALNNKKETRLRKQNVFDLFPFLAQKRNVVAGKMSGGEQQMVALGRILMIKPKLLLLDEPSLGLAPKMVEKVFEMLKTINSFGITILLVEQNVKMALQVTHRAYVLNLGKIAFQGTTQEILKNNKLKLLYLGE